MTTDAPSVFNRSDAAQFDSAAIARTGDWDQYVTKVTKEIANDCRSMYQGMSGAVGQMFGDFGITGIHADSDKDKNTLAIKAAHTSREPSEKGNQQALSLLTSLDHNQSNQEPYTKLCADLVGGDIVDEAAHLTVNSTLEQAAPTDATVSRDLDGRLTSVCKDGFSAMVTYKDDASKETKSVSLYDRNGVVIENVDGAVSFDRTTGAITVSRKHGDASSLARDDVKIIPGGLVEHNKYGGTGLREEQEATRYSFDQGTKVTTSFKFSTRYEYFSEKGDSTDNPVLVTKATGSIHDAKYRRFAKEYFGSCAALEAGKPYQRYDTL